MSTLSSLFSLLFNDTWPYRHFYALFRREFVNVHRFLQFFTQRDSFPRFYVAKTRRDKFWKVDEMVGRLRTCAEIFFGTAKDAGNRKKKLSFFPFLQLTIFYSIVNNNKQSTFTLLCARSISARWVHEFMIRRSVSVNCLIQSQGQTDSMRLISWQTNFTTRKLRLSIFLGI